ncbi:Glycosyl transferase [Sphingomonas paucimobilis]|nr:Glycosyl transferase [Sphingomonas paucimobilis]
MKLLSPSLTQMNGHDGRAARRDRQVRLCFPFSGDTIGGSHISVKGLLDHLDRGRYRLVVVPEVPGGRIAQFFAGHEQLHDPGSRGLFVPGERFNLRKFARTLGGLWSRTRFLRRNRIDIVHVNDGQTNANWAVAARLAGAKLVWHHRGDPGALGLRLLAPLLANQVLTVSSFSLPPPGPWSARKKAAVVHSPFDATMTVDREQARETLVRELGIAPDTLILGYFGAFIARKRPLLFIDMIAALKEKLDRPVIGVMFGESVEPSMNAALQRRIDGNGVAAQVRLMGYRTPGAYWIAACDQLAVPAVREPFGRTLVEAMLAGTPIVAARSGGNIEALEGGIGILADPDDAGALAEQCARLARDPAAASAMARRAQADARHRFSEAVHGRKVSEVYERLCPAA